MSKKFCLSVLNDYEKLLESEEEYDTLIYVGQCQKEFRVHSVILRIRSQYFRTAFSNRWAERRSGMFILRKPNIDPDIFKIILRFIYYGSIDFDGLQGPEVLKLIIASEELSVQRLVSHLKEYLEGNKLEFLNAQPIKILKMIRENLLFTKLWDDCLEIICEEPEIVFSSEEFSSLDEPLLKDLLRCNAFKIDEAKIWESVIKWGLAKHPSFGQNVTRLSKNQFRALNVTLEEIVPLIRFDYFDSTDVYHKILPYKKLLSKEIVDGLLKKYLDRSDFIRCCHRTRYHKIGASTVLTPYHYAVFANWIGKDESTYKIHNIPYKFDLLYRHHLKDSMNLPTLHSICNRIKETLIVARIKDSNQLVGGYNPIGFKIKNSYRNTRNSFIFTFTDKDEVKTGKCSYVSRPEILNQHLVLIYYVKVMVLGQATHHLIPQLVFRKVLK